MLFRSIACSILNTIFDLAPPYLIGIAIDVVVKPDSSLISQFGITNLTHQLAIVSGLTLLIWSLESLTEYGYSRLWRNLAQTLQHDLRVDAYSHLQDLELSYLEDRSTGTLLSILNDDINHLERFLNDSFNAIIQMITLVLFAGWSLCIVSLELGLVGMLPIPFIILGSIYYQNKIAPHYREVRERVGELGSRLENNISGIQVIKSFTAEDFELQRVR